MTFHPASRDQQQERLQLDQLALLYSMADHIQRARNLDSIYAEAVSGLCRVLGADRSALLLSDGGGTMRFEAWENLSEEYRAAVEGHSPWPQGERDPRPVLIEDAGMDERLGELRGVVLEEGILALAFIPLLHRGRLLGKFMIYYDQPRRFLPEEIRVAQAIAGHLAFAIWRGRSDADQAELLRRFEAERSVLESVVKQMPAGVMLADVPSGRIIMANQQIAQAWRRPLRNAGGVAEYATWQGHFPDGSGPLAPEDWPLARSVEAGETVRGEEIEIVRGDGTRGVLRMSSAPVLDSQGRQLAAVATVYDITDEKAAEEERKFLGEATRVLNASLDLTETLDQLAALVVGRRADWCMIHRVDEDGVVTRAVSMHRDPESQDLAARFVGERFRVEDEGPVPWVIREQKPLLLPELTEETLRISFPEQALYEAAREMRPSSLLVVPLVARDRSIGAVALARSEGRYGQGEMDQMTEFARRAALALDNAHLYEKARAADESKSNFLAVMSHEFRTPLSAILGYSDILTAGVHGELNGMQRRHLERVKASVRHLSHLVDEILSFASMETGREKIRESRVELVELAADAAAIMEPIAEATGLDLRVRLPSRPVHGLVDSSKLNQILINLLSNALKYTHEGYVEFQLRVEGGRVRCEVSDTGPGIPAEHLEDVFIPFWQVERSDGRRITGTGLGLAVARRLARLMDGDVYVKSELGKGSTFTLDLPLKLPEGEGA